MTEQSSDIFFDKPTNQFEGMLSVFHGQSLLAKLLTDPTFIGFFLSTTRSRVQEIVAYASYFMEHRRLAESEADKTEMWELFNRMQDNYRVRLKEAITQFEIDQDPTVQRWRTIRQEEERRREVTRQWEVEHGRVSKPHEQGTVKELAAKLGLSISEVRRLKRDEPKKLDELLTAQKATQ